MSEQKKSRKKKSLADYKEQAKIIKPFADFPIDLRKKLSKSDKAKITKYYNAVDSLTARTSYAYKPRNKKRLKLAQQFSHTDPAHKHLPHLKVAFIPVPEENARPVIGFTDKGMRIKSFHVTSHFLPFNRRKLLKNPRAHVEETIKIDPEANAFTVRCGNFEINSPKPRWEIAKYVNDLITDSRYSTPGTEHYAGDWLVGLTSHQFKNQETEDTYVRVKQRASRKLKREHSKRAAARRKTKIQEKETADKAAREKELLKAQKEIARLKKQNRLLSAKAGKAKK